MPFDPEKLQELMNTYNNAERGLDKVDAYIELNTYWCDHYEEIQQWMYDRAKEIGFI